jgi:hypothetical protein
MRKWIIEEERKEERKEGRKEGRKEVPGSSVGGIDPAITGP